MNVLPIVKQKQILQLLVEGNSLRSISRIIDCSINTVFKLLVEVGKGCLKYQDEIFHNLNCKYIQVDEMWDFCYAKQKNVEKAKRPPKEAGNIWTWIAIDTETKLVPSWLVGKRDASYAYKFIKDVANRLAHKIQLTSDGWKPYIEAVEDAFGNDIDYGMLVKIYDQNQRYTGCELKRITGSPNNKRISTSIVERNNLTLRMHMRRYTRKTNGFSKKLENHKYALALNFMSYNFGRIHSTIKVTPAMEAGISNHIWEIEEILALRIDR
ncbi:MAG: IS1 family transposase [Candidatus Thorarchaeota archaeon]